LLDSVSYATKLIDVSLAEWINTLTKQQKKEFILSVRETFEKAHIQSLYELKSPIRGLKLLMNMITMDKANRGYLFTLIKILLFHHFKHQRKVSSVDYDILTN